MPSKLVNECSQLLAERKLKIAFAESATAGRMAAEFAMTEFSGDILIGGLVCYDAIVKENILGVSKNLVEEFTPESAEVTREMASKLKHFMPADIHVAITGLTTPGGSETKDKPVGSIFLNAVIQGKQVEVFEIFNGSDSEIVMQAIDRLAQLLLDEVA